MNSLVRGTLRAVLAVATACAVCVAIALLPIGPAAQAAAASGPSAVSPAVAGGAASDPAAGHHAGSEIAKHEGRPQPSGSVVPSEGQLLGLDVSGYQGDVDWAAVAAKGAKFAYVKATEGATYRNPHFAQQYNGSQQAGLIRGAYHFALPDVSDGASQANFFVDHGGGWSPDGNTLPPALDIEYNPYGSNCYGLTHSRMVGWIKAFSDQVHARTSRWPAIYTTTNWWSTCTGNLGGFSATNPLWVARYASSPGPLPFDWGTYTFWQFADAGKVPGDQNYFNGTMDQLRALARG